MTEPLQRAFAHPMGLALLALLPTLSVAGFLAARHRRRRLQRLGSPQAIRMVTTGRRRFAWLKRLLLTSAFTALITGIAGPQWGRDEAVAGALGRDVVVVLDLSRSMLAQDVLPNRAGRAKQAIEDLLATISRRGGHRIALVVFAAGPQVVCPLTQDYDHVRKALADLDPAQPSPALAMGAETAASGTRIGAGLLTAVETHDDTAQGYQDILLISDGDDPARDEEWRIGAIEARKRNIPVHTVGVGNPDAFSPIPGRDGKPLYFEGREVTTRLEEEPLQLIANWTGGVYVPGRTDRLPLGQLFRERIETAPGRELRDDFLPAYYQHYSWFFSIALSLIGLHMGLGSRQPRAARQIKSESGDRGKSVSGLLLASAALFLVSASPLDDAAESLVRQGNRALTSGAPGVALEAYARAEEATEDPGLVAFDEGLALYELGRFREAELHFLRAREDATGPRLAHLLLGLGNAIVQQVRDTDAQRLRQAIRRFEECLNVPEASPEIVAAARHNLELARLLWAKARARKGSKDSETSDKDRPPNEPEDRRPEGETGDEDMMRELRKGEGKRERQGKAAEDPQATAESDDPRPRPASGNLPPIPDRDELAPLSPEDAAEHLRIAAERIEKERLQYRDRLAPVNLPHVKNW
jgi:Ca-activated chloride channel family protein